MFHKEIIVMSKLLKVMKVREISSLVALICLSTCLRQASLLCTLYVLPNDSSSTLNLSFLSLLFASPKEIGRGLSRFQGFQFQSRSLSVCACMCVAEEESELCRERRYFKRLHTLKWAKVG